ncbi:cytosolic phospholipase A2 gamma-like [Macrochelys suwanniensis]
MERTQLRKNDGRVRLSHELSEGEKEATGKRKAKVLECLKSLNIACAEDNTPNIAVLGSGGGLRAMIALQGTLVELKNQGLLDAVMYLCGVSGSTWCMSFLYQEKYWTEKVQVLEESMCATFCNPCNIQKEFTIATQAAEDELFSLTDDWASFFVYTTLKQYAETKLSEHKDASTNGTNPYPIYAAIKAKHTNDSPETWFEFTPHESGFSGLGAFVCTEDLGSKFKDGDLKEKREEKNIGYLQGLWGSALGNMDANKKYLIDTDCTCTHCRGVLHLLELHFHASSGEVREGIFKQLKEVLKEENSKNSYLKCCEVHETWDLKTGEERIVEFAQLIRIFEKELGGTDCTSAHCRGVLLFLELHIHASAGGDCEGIFRQLKDVLKGYIWHLWELVWKTVNCICHWTWGCTNNFLYKSSDAQSTGLSNYEFIYLIDAGIAINSAYPLVLRPERKVKLILSFDFSDGDPFETINKTAKYCKTNHIPFPKIDIKDPDNLSDCYIFRGKDVPTVMHFPLFNTKNCPVLGEIEQLRKRFTTFTTHYPEDNVKQLLQKAKMNVSNNKTKILKEIQQIVSCSTKEF